MAALRQAKYRFMAFFAEVRRCRCNDAGLCPSFLGEFGNLGANPFVSVSSTFCPHFINRANAGNHKCIYSTWVAWRRTMDKCWWSVIARLNVWVVRCHLIGLPVDLGTAPMSSSRNENHSLTGRHRALAHMGQVSPFIGYIFMPRKKKLASGPFYGGLRTLHLCRAA